MRASTPRIRGTSTRAAGYVHDPLMHGPEQFHVNALIFFLFGDNDVTARLQYVLLGTFMIGLPYFVRHELGRLAAIIAAIILTISPGFLYFSRFAREDMPFAFFTMVHGRGALWLHPHPPAETPVCLLRGTFAGLCHEGSDLHHRIHLDCLHRCDDRPAAIRHGWR